jgi:Zn-dependent protease
MLDISPELLRQIAVAVPVLAVSITLHELAHAYTAWKLGDLTAHTAGRVTVNPIRHLTLMGTFVVPALLMLSGMRLVFGWTKPVPIDPLAFDRPRRAMILIAAAGPLANLLLAVVAMGALGSLALAETRPEPLVLTLSAFAYLNVLLALFNLLPIPPFDGGRILVGLAPEGLARRLVRFERWGLWIVLSIFFVPPLVGQLIGIDLDVFRWTLLPAIEAVLSVLEAATGAAMEWRWL